MGNKMKYNSLTIFLIALILTHSITSNFTPIKTGDKKSKFLEKQIKSATTSAEDYLYDISNFAYEYLNNLGEKGVTFPSFEKIVRKIDTKRNIPTQILQEKFKQYDSNAWGLMNFNDFSKFLKEFLIIEAESNIESRKFQNETMLNYTDFEEGNLKNISLRINKNLPLAKNSKKNMPVNKAAITKAKAPTNPTSTPDAHPHMKVFLEKGFNDKEKEGIQKKVTKNQEKFEKNKQILDKDIQKNAKNVPSKSKQNKVVPIKTQKNFIKKKEEKNANLDKIKINRKAENNKKENNNNVNKNNDNNNVNKNKIDKNKIDKNLKDTISISVSSNVNNKGKKNLEKNQKYKKNTKINTNEKKTFR